MSRRALYRMVLASLALVAAVAMLRSGILQSYALPTAETFRRLRPGAVIAVLSLTMLSAILSGIMWCRLLGQVGHALPLSTGLSAFAGTGLASYVGNAAGSTVGGVVYLRRQGLQPGRAAIVVLMANALGLCGVLVWAPIGLMLVSRPDMRDALPLVGSHDLAAVAWAFAGLGVCMLVSLWLLASADRTAWRLTHRVRGKAVWNLQLAASAGGSRLRLMGMLRLVPWSAAAWLVGTMVLYAMLAGLEPASAINLMDVVGASAVAAALGSLAFFIPSGVGVRDGALIVLLSRSTGVPMPSCAAAVLTLRALDPLSKLGIVLLVACGAFDRMSAYSLTCRNAVMLRLRFDLDLLSALIAQRGPGRRPVPVREVAQTKADWEI